MEFIKNSGKVVSINIWDQINGAGGKATRAEIEKLNTDKKAISEAGKQYILAHFDQIAGADGKISESEWLRLRDAGIGDGAFNAHAEFFNKLPTVAAAQQAQADTQAKAQADAQAKADADAQAKAQADAQAKADADAKAKADADAQAKVPADAQASSSTQTSQAAASEAAPVDKKDDNNWWLKLFEQLFSGNATDILTNPLSLIMGTVFPDNFFGPASTPLPFSTEITIGDYGISQSSPSPSQSSSSSYLDNLLGDDLAGLVRGHGNGNAFSSNYSLSLLNNSGSLQQDLAAYNELMKSQRIGQNQP